MPRYRISTIVEHCQFYYIHAESPEEAAALFRRGQLDGKVGDFIGESDPDICVQDEAGDWMDLPMPPNHCDVCGVVIESNEAGCCAACVDKAIEKMRGTPTFPAGWDHV